MTFECGMRFLTDYLEGDHYFKIHREGHNLDRCRTQFRLVEDMEKKWDIMQSIVKNIRDNYAKPLKEQIPERFLWYRVLRISYTIKHTACMMRSSRR